MKISESILLAAWNILWAMVLLVGIACVIASVIALVSSTAHAQTQLVPPAKLKAMLATLPECEDPTIFEPGEFQDILKDPTTLWYTHAEMPPAYQIGGGADGNIGPLRFADVMINVSNAAGEGDKPDGEGGSMNIDSPWRPRPGGTARVVNLRDFKGMWLPKKPDGKPYPVAHYQRVFTDQRRRGDRATGTDWIFPVGTVFIEVLHQRGPDGRDYVFEIRIRKRVTGSWEADVLRPFPTMASLERELRKMNPQWHLDEKTREVVRLLRDDERKVPTFTLVESEPGESFQNQTDDIVTFKGEAKIDFLPELANDHNAATKYLLTNTAFTSALREDWTIGNDAHGFGLVPYQYDGQFIEPSFIGCMECHRHCGLASRLFDRGRGWQGALRGGNEQIISWHPIEPSSYVRTKQGRPGPVVFRQAFIDAGMLERWEPDRHPAKMYHLLRELPRP